MLINVDLFKPKPGPVGDPEYPATHPPGYKARYLETPEVVINTDAIAGIEGYVKTTGIEGETEGIESDIDVAGEAGPAKACRKILEGRKRRIKN